MSTLTATGTRDYLPYEVKIRRKIFERLCVVAETHAFQPIETPGIERIEALEGKYGEEGEKLLFKIMKRGEKAASGECDLVLRYDLTVPAMRFYAEHRNELPKIFKRYQFGPVWRADKPGKGRYREFFQFDFDIYGSNSYMADVECLNMLTDSLHNLGIKNYKVRLNSRKLLIAMMQEFEIPQDMYKVILTQIDKTDKIGVEGLAENLREYSRVGKIPELIEIFLSNDFNAILLAKLGANQKYLNDIEELTNIINMTKFFVSPPEIAIDMTLARGLDYYTGPIYELEAPGVKGSIAAGGRYDTLSRLFMKDDIPVCGSSLGIERIIPLVDISILNLTPSVDIYLASDGGDFETLYKLSSQLREQGFYVEIQNGGGGKIGKELSYAGKISARFFVYRGENEEKEGSILIKDMESSVQHVIPLADVLVFFTGESKIHNR